MTTLKKEITIDDPHGHYHLVLKKKCRWCWLWLLLLLLPFLLLIPLKKEIEIQLIDTQSGIPVANEIIKVQYQYRSLYSFAERSFFLDTLLPEKPLEQLTNDEGKASFITSYSIYQWASWYEREKDTLYAKVDSKCAKGDSTYNHFKMNAWSSSKLLVQGKTSSQSFTVFDKIDQEPLPEAMVRVRDPITDILIDSARSNVNGKVYFDDLLSCSSIEIITSKYGWKSDTLKILVSGIRNNNIYLDREMGIVSFYVQNKYTQKPLPGAHGELYLATEPYLQIGPDAVTNINGLGKAVAVFDSTQIISEIKINVNYDSELRFYHDTSSFDHLKWIAVDKWNNQPEKERVLFLRPQPYDLDIVMCIDATSSMANVINQVKSRSKNIYRDLQKEMAKVDKYTGNVHVKIISFANYCSDPYNLVESRFFSIPNEIAAYRNSLNDIKATGDDEIGLEALSLAFTSNFKSSRTYRRKIIIVMTDDDAQELGKSNCSDTFPRIANTFDELRTQWDRIRSDSRLVILTRQKSRKKPLWGKVAIEWPQTSIIESERSVNQQYQEALELVAKEL